MKFNLVKQELTEQDLSDFESTRSILLPKSYKEHMLKFNGGTPEKKYYNGVQIAFFNPIKYGNDTLKDVIEDLQDIIPDKFLPIAYDPGNNQICLNLNNDDNYGYVYYLAMDLGEPKPSLIAKSLEELLKGLSEENDY